MPDNKKRGANEFLFAKGPSKTPPRRFFDQCVGPSSAMSITYLQDAGVPNISSERPVKATRLA